MGRDPKFYNDLYNLGIAEREELSGEELAEFRKTPAGALPEDIYYSVPSNAVDKPENRTYYRYKKLPEQEASFRLAVTNAKSLNTIRKCAVFFVILFLVAVLAGFYICARRGLL